MTSQAVKDKIDAHIKNDNVFAATKSYCPHCKATKQLLDQLKIEYSYEDLDLLPEGAEMQEYLQEVSGQRTVPNIFIKGKHIGGNSDLQALNKEGKLMAMI